MAGTSDVVRENESVHARPISRQSHSTGMVEERVKAKILVVDDDPQARDMYQRLVATELPDHIVHTADGGAAALPGRESRGRLSDPRCLPT